MPPSSKRPRDGDDVRRAAYLESRDEREAYFGDADLDDSAGPYASYQPAVSNPHSELYAGTRSLQWARLKSHHRRPSR